MTLWTLWTVTVVLQGLTIAGLIAQWLFFNSAKAFAEEKGKNLATKQDTGAITLEVELVKASFQNDFESFKQRLTIDLEYAKFIATMRQSLFERLVRVKEEIFAQGRPIAEIIQEFATYFRARKVVLGELGAETAALEEAIRNVGVASSQSSPIASDIMKALEAMLDEIDTVMGCLVRLPKSSI